MIKDWFDNEKGRKRIASMNRTTTPIIIIFIVVIFILIMTENDCKSYQYAYYKPLILFGQVDSVYFDVEKDINMIKISSLNETTQYLQLKDAVAENEIFQFIQKNDSIFKSYNSDIVRIKRGKSISEFTLNCKKND